MEGCCGAGASISRSGMGTGQGVDHMAQKGIVRDPGGDTDVHLARTGSDFLQPASRLTDPSSCLQTCQTFQVILGKVTGAGCMDQPRHHGQNRDTSRCQNLCQAGLLVLFAVGSSTCGGILEPHPPLPWLSRRQGDACWVLGPLSPFPTVWEQFHLVTLTSERTLQGVTKKK
jgi:hypothetical protein